MVPKPYIGFSTIKRRMYCNIEEADDPSGEICGIVTFGFSPPKSASDWPKTIDDIGNDTMQRVLRLAKNGAAGSKPFSHYFKFNKLVLCDGVVYTDDSLFWLSKITPRSRPRFVYRTFATNPQNNP